MTFQCPWHKGQILWGPVLPVADFGKEEADEGMLAELAPPPLPHVVLSPSRKAFQNKAVNLVKQN